MNWDQVQGKWKQFRGRVQERWGELTHDDLEAIEGRQDQLVGRIQERYGMEKENARREVDDWLRGL